MQVGGCWADSRPSALIKKIAKSGRCSLDPLADFAANCCLVPFDPLTATVRRFDEQVGIFLQRGALSSRSCTESLDIEQINRRMS